MWEPNPIDQISLLLKKLEKFSTAPEEFQNAFGDPEKGYATPADVKRDIEALKSLSEDKMPAHLARFVRTAKLATQFAYDAVTASTDGYGSYEQTALKGFRQLQNDVLEDNKVDDLEKAFLIYTLVRLNWQDGSPISAGGLLAFLADGNCLPEKLDGPTPVPNSNEKAYLNAGPKNEPEMCQYAEGYTPLSWDDPRVKDRDLRDTCFLFALSGTPSWKLPELYKNAKYHPLDQNLGMPSDYYFNHLRDHFRTVDLEREASRQGDIIAYYGSADTDPNRIQFNIKHMAVVTEVDENGYPIMAISRLGYGEVVEHPVDQVPLFYGFLWVVKRDKSLD
ncbi:MAG: hypothetical protein HYY43_00205, partial [Deltaproteobacteria bacterium]|nr:hypothetical protein [Deltaproteobacteria bacterium]